MQQSSIPNPNPKPVASVSPRQSPSSPRRQQYVVVSRPTPDADPEDFSRRLKISSSPSPSPRPSQSAKARKLFNPDTDPIPMRRTDPEPISGPTSTQQASRLPPPSSSTNHRDERGSTARHLFDHRKDDPVRFSVMARPQLLAPGRPSPTPKSSRNHVSASSNSSYAASISSSAFTLSSTTDESSTSSSLFDGRPNQDRAENSIFAHQLKRLYREISNLEAKVKQEDSMDDTDDVMSSRVVLKGKEVENDDLEKEKWKKQMSDHKTLVFFVHLGNISYLKRLYFSVWPKTSITCSKSPYRLLFRRLCELSQRSTILLFVYGPMPSTNYLNLSVAPLLLLHWLWSISRTSFTTPTYFTQVFLKIRLLSPLNLDGWKLLEISLGIGWRWQQWLMTPAEVKVALP